MSFKWRLYYDDGSTFSDTEGAPHESPMWGIVGVSQPWVSGIADPATLANGDWLLFRDDEGFWHEVGDKGLDDHIVHFGHLISCARKTRWMPRRDKFLAIVARMREEAVDA